MNKSSMRGPIVIPVVDPEIIPDKNPIHAHLPQIAGPGGGALLQMMLPPDFYSKHSRHSITIMIVLLTASLTRKRNMKKKTNLRLL